MSSKNTASADQKVFLRTFKDWANWDRTFCIKAEALDIWHLIDPDQDHQPLSRPVRPSFSDYFRRISPQLIEPDLPRQTRQARVKRGAFGPTYDEDPDRDDQPNQEQDPDKEGQPAGSSGSAGPSRAKRNKKRKSDQTGPQAKKNKSAEDLDQGDNIPSCEACGGNWHAWSKCYYIFPSKAPASFKPQSVLQDTVKYRLSKPEWKDKLKALKGAAEPAKSD
ncbi:polyprotein [Ilyonectria robusta]